MDRPHQGFRFGVRELVCERPQSLLDFVGTANQRAELGALDLIELGSVYVNEQRSLNPSLPLRSGDRVRIHASPRRFAAPSDLGARIVSEDGETIVVDKPAGLPLEPTVDNVRENLLSFLEDLRGQRFHLVHQLETESAGLVMIGKSVEATARASRAFAEGRLKRTFAVFTETAVEVGIAASEAEEFAMSVLGCEERIGRTNVLSEGRSTFEIEGHPLERVYRLELELSRGRPQRLRETLARLGAPAIGDAENGSSVTLLDAKTRKPVIAMRATQLSLE